MLKNTQFSLYTAFLAGFKIFKANLKFFVLLWFCVMAISFAIKVLSSFMAIMPTQQHLIFGCFMLLAISFPLIVAWIGYLKIAFALHDKKNFSWKYFYQYYALVPRVVAASLIMSALFLLLPGLGGGIALCALYASKIYESLLFALLAILIAIFFLPYAIFVYQRLRFTIYFIIDKNLSLRKAFRSSWDLTQGAVLHLFAFSILSTCLSILTLFLWVLATMFFEQVNVNIFRQMLKNK
jgi:hypothetical protein